MARNGAPPIKRETVEEIWGLMVGEGLSLIDATILWNVERKPSVHSVSLRGISEYIYRDRDLSKQMEEVRAQTAHTMCSKIKLEMVRLHKEGYSDQFIREWTNSTYWTISRVARKDYGDRKHVDYTEHVEPKPEEVEQQLGAITKRAREAAKRRIN